jgi:hypothetical protein
VGRAQQAKLRAGGGGAAAAPKGRAGGGAAAAKGKRGGERADTLDAALMAKLGEDIKQMKHDFIMVHLAHECCRCRRTLNAEPVFVAPRPPPQHCTTRLARPPRPPRSSRPAGADASQDAAGRLRASSSSCPSSPHQQQA